jgi:Spy/CpxP family protein refolding chaperone
MSKRYLNIFLAMVMTLVIAAPGLTLAGNLPETPITKVLNYQTGLALTDAQVKNLSLINNNIINKMLQLQGQAQRCKSEIDQMMADWSSLDNPKAKSTVKEYYQCQADLKSLEMEAMAKASKVLSDDQIKKFGELMTIELIMINSIQTQADLD